MGASEVEVISRVRRARRAIATLQRGARSPGDAAAADGALAELRDLEAEIARLAEDRRVATQRLHDTEERYEQVRQAEKMEAVGRLASGIAHDFNNALMGVTGLVDVALARGPSDTIRLYLEEIRGAASSAGAITRELLAFGRKRPAEISAQDVDRVLARCEYLCLHLLGEDIELRFELGAGGARVACAPGQIEQIVMNLVANARDAMPGGGELVVDTHVVAGEDVPAEVEARSCVLIRFTDTGCGMDEDTRDRVFEPFFTTKEVHRGTGLGLATVYAVVSRCRGHVRVESSPGHGTSILLYLPEEEGAVTADEPEAPAPIGSGETVLVVEDDSLVRLAVRHYLADAGYRVLEATTGPEAVERARRLAGDLDVVVTDVVLPGLGGEQVARRIARLEPEARVVFMSAHPRDLLLESGRIAPSTWPLQKPFTRAQLLTRVDEAIAGTGAISPALRGPASARTALAAHEAGSAPVVQEAAPALATVLLVEDHGVSRAAVAELLADVGYQVLAAASGAQALELCRAHTGAIDLLVTDFGLPDCSGGEVARQVRARHTGAAVIYLSGRDRADPELEQALEDPRSAYLAKPVEFADLDALARSLVLGGGGGGGAAPPRAPASPVR